MRGTGMKTYKVVVQHTERNKNGRFPLYEIIKIQFKYNTVIIHTNCDIF